VAHAAPDDSILLQAGKPLPQAAIALVGAGTGLGVASLVWNGLRYLPCASEGGHVGFAPHDELQLELCRHLLARHGRASAERVLCGAGLVAIYKFLQGETLDDPAAISARALADPSSLAARALDLFVSCYGAFAGDMALAFLARGGVYVCGGIAAKLARRLAAGDFLAAFNEKGRHRELVASIPVRVVTNEKLGLLGAARAAA
jgi:glucokinase